MPPRRFKKKFVKRLVEKHVAKAIEEYEKNRANLDSAGSSGGNRGNAGGTMNCAEEDKVMFAASTFEGCALTWWNGNVHTLGLVNANHIPWTEFKMMMTTEYCLTIEIQRMEQELWTLTLKGDDIEAYNYRFHELALMCPELVPTEKKKIERYTRRFPERIKGNFTSYKPATLPDASTWPMNWLSKQFRVGLPELVKAIKGSGKTIKETTTTTTTITTTTVTETTTITNNKIGDRKLPGPILQPQLRIEVMLGIYQSATVATFTIIEEKNRITNVENTVLNLGDPESFFVYFL
ncbi:putative reverse transcriptase domain-containing protein [Tanacetum coccineum]|uniref:Reverse transcriptase domain-containing protein n=1 Tax=Tanacetum coccineum TaxID=301880 RepID=A0ABQ5E6Q1_9ASTR